MSDFKFPKYNFPKQLYVGCQNRVDFDTKTFPLGFATPYGTDAAFKKRRETLERWMGDGYKWEYEKNPDGSYAYETDAHGRKGVKGKKVVVGTAFPQVIDNVPIEGFTISKAVSRYSTSNKWFEICDPRGFTLQVSAYNIVELMMNNVIAFGVLKGEYVWARDGAVNALVSAQSKEYKNFLQPKKALKPQIGDHIISKSTNGIFSGMFYVAMVSRKDKNRYGYYNHRISPMWEYTISKSKDPYICLTETNKYNKELYFHFVKSFGKDFIIDSSGNKVTEPGLGVQESGHYSGGLHTQYYVIFRTKAEMDAYVLDDTVAESFYDKRIK